MITASEHLVWLLIAHAGPANLRRVGLVIVSQLDSCSLCGEIPVSSRRHSLSLAYFMGTGGQDRSDGFPQKLLCVDSLWGGVCFTPTVSFLLGSDCQAYRREGAYEKPGWREGAWWVIWKVEVFKVLWLRIAVGLGLSLGHVRVGWNCRTSEDSLETFAVEARLELFCIEMGVSLEKDSSRSQSQEGLCMLGVSIDVVWFTMIVIFSDLCVSSIIYSLELSVFVFNTFLMSSLFIGFSKKRSKIIHLCMCWLIHCGSGCFPAQQPERSGVSCPVCVQVWPSTESLPITHIPKECWSKPG